MDTGIDGRICLKWLPGRGAIAHRKAESGTTLNRIWLYPSYEITPAMIEDFDVMKGLLHTILNDTVEDAMTTSGDNADSICLSTIFGDDGHRLDCLSLPCPCGAVSWEIIPD